MLGIVGGLVGLSVYASLPWESAYLIAAAVVALGMVVAVPTGFVYHVRLHKVLSQRQELPKGWYWHPIPYNAQLEKPHEWDHVMPWCYVGAGGFFVSVLGFVMMGVAMMSAYAQAVA